MKSNLDVVMELYHVGARKYRQNIYLYVLIQKREEDFPMTGVKS